ncbi:MAG: phosphoglycerol transferase MdoB-like AlkP superfamily enzyme [Oceanicoccus sp.]|jgi:phosphoglycerol transferase MdoB-like AlkP superfamily enzyme
MGFVIWKFPRVLEAGNVWLVFAQGFRFDLAMLSMLTILPALVTPIFASFKSVWSGWQKFVSVYLTICFVTVLFMEFSTPSFVNEFDQRPNFIFVEYLQYPKEVFSTLMGAYALALVGASVLTILGGWYFYRLLNRNIGNATIKLWQGLLFIPVILIMQTLFIRSTLEHRPLNPSNAAFTKDLLVNDFAMNSTYSVAYAVYSSFRHEAGSKGYGDISRENVIKTIRQEMAVSEEDFLSDEIPTLHQQYAIVDREEPLNLVIILEESLGSEYVGALGGLPITPRLDELSKEGLWFKNLYATGTRSVRGIEAVVTGFTPTAARSVVKLNKSQQGFFSIAELLKSKGYDTSFIYGGNANFDNMRHFFVGNGFNRVIEEKDFVSPDFSATWGVSDEDLFNRADEEFSAYAKEKKPFFSLIFSSSNHSPFEFPENKIENYTKEKATVENAVKYADYALGEFIDKARKSEYWENTLFLVIADHNSRVRGASLVPIERFHIPGLILGKDIAASEYENIASQIDMIPTLLSLMGISSQHPAIGHDLLHERFADYEGRAIMQYNSVQAFMEGNSVIIFEREKEPAQFDYINGELVEAKTTDEILLNKALAYSAFGPLSYNENLYRLPQKTP